MMKVKPASQIFLLPFLHFCPLFLSLTQLYVWEKKRGRKKNQKRERERKKMEKMIHYLTLSKRTKMQSIRFIFGNEENEGEREKGRRRERKGERESGTEMEARNKIKEELSFMKRKNFCLRDREKFQTSMLEREREESHSFSVFLSINLCLNHVHEFILVLLLSLPLSFPPSLFFSLHVWKISPFLLSL